MIIAFHCQARPRYRKRKQSRSEEFSVGPTVAKGEASTSGSSGAPGLLVPKLAPSRSVREAIQEVKMVQVGISFLSVLLYESLVLVSYFRLQTNEFHWKDVSLWLLVYKLTLSLYIFDVSNAYNKVTYPYIRGVNMNNLPIHELFQKIFHDQFCLCSIKTSNANYKY